MRCLTKKAMILAVFSLVTGLTVAEGAAEESKSAGDSILLSGQPPRREVTVTEDSWKKVVFERNGVPQTLNPMDVSLIHYGEDTDSVIRKAAIYIRRGQYHEAINNYLKPLEAKLGTLRKVKGRPWAEQYCYYYLGLAYLGRANAAKNDAKSASSYFSKLLSSSPDTRFVFEAIEYLGESYMLTQNYSEAVKHYRKATTKFDSMAGEPGIPAVLALRLRRGALTMKIRRAEALIFKGDGDKSTGLLSTVASSARLRYPDIYFAAKSTTVLAHIATGAYQNGIENAKALIKEGEKMGKPEYIGQAYYALAECHFERAEKQRAENRDVNISDLRAARYYYSRVCAMYFDDARMQPKAMLRSGICSSRIKSMTRNALDRKQATKLANRQFTALIAGFPRSQEAAVARKLLRN